MFLLVATMAIASPHGPIASSIPAMADVSAALNQGGWTHTVPLELLPAPAGAAPGLSLVADFHVSDGPLGPNWMLSGFSRIERRSPTNGVPRFDAYDDFYIDGQRLYNTGWTLWQPEHDDNRQFTFDASDNLWLARKDGWTWIYGEYEDGSIWRGMCAAEVADINDDLNCTTSPGGTSGDSTTTTAWLISRVEDPSGNVITFDYTTNQMLGSELEPAYWTVLPLDHTYDHVPTTITYNAGTSVVTLEWEPRPDVTASGRSGIMRALPTRLAAIEVAGDSGSVVDSTYEIEYLDEATNGCIGETLPTGVDLELTSVLHRITRVGRMGTERELRCVETSAEVASWTERPVGDSELGPLGIGDDDDDDYAQEPPGGLPSIGGPLSTPVVVNFGGDSLPDLAVLSLDCVIGETPEIRNSCASHTFRYWGNLGGTFEEVTGGGTGPLAMLADGVTHDLLVDQLGGWTVIDIDRDGDTDLITASMSSTYGWSNRVQVRALNPDGTWDTHDDWIIFDDDDVSTNEEAPVLLQHGQFTDVDGDGFVDLVLPPDALVATSLDGIVGDTQLTHWIRNRGEAPYLDIDDLAEMVDVPFDADTVPDDFWTADDADCSTSTATDPVTAPPSLLAADFGQEGGEGQVDCSELTDAECVDARNVSVESTLSTLTIRDTGLDYQSTRDYRVQQARWGDYNNDGIADVAFSLYACWDDSTTEDPAISPAVETAFSRIYFGDGTGAVHDGLISAGPPPLAELDIDPDQPSESGFDAEEEIRFGNAKYGPDRWRYASTIAAVDLDGSGRLDLIYGLGLPASPDGGLYRDGFAVDAGGALSAVGSTHDRTIAETYLPGFALSSRLIPPHDELLADWDGDGFVDVLRVNQGWYGGDVTNAVLYTNDRATPRYRITKIHDAWGGEAALTYASSAEVGKSEDLPWPMLVIGSVADSAGTTTFQFDGGTWWGKEARFLGFRDASMTYEGGGASDFRYAIRPWTAGALVYRTDRRADGTIERFDYWSVWNPSGTNLTVDAEAPYFNPPRRHCSFWVGPGHIVAGHLVQDMDEGALIERCDTANGGRTLGMAFTDMMGWTGDDDMPPPGMGIDLWDLFAGQLVFNGQEHAQYEGYWWAEIPMEDREDYPPLAGDAPESLAIPDPEPSPPGRVVAGATTLKEYGETWAYDTDQRVVSHRDYRELATSGDDLVTLTTYADWDAGAAGKEVIETELTDGTGTPLRTIDYTPSSVFDQPSVVTESAGSSAWEWTYTYDRGEVASVEDPEGGVDTFMRDACGQPTERTDALDRSEVITRDDLCRAGTRTWLGSETTYDRDDLGRVTVQATDPGDDASETITETWFRNDDPWDGTDWLTLRAGVYYGDGSMHQSWLDPYGREGMTLDCMSSGAPASLNAMTCVSGTEHYAYRGWATDGTARVATGLFGDPSRTEPIPASWTYDDEFGRTETTLSPSPEMAEDYVETDFTYLPGQTTAVDPVGIACTTTFGTLSTSGSCNSTSRGSQTLDRLGRVIDEADALGTHRVTTYDDFGRPVHAELGTAVTTCGGTSKLGEDWTWSDTDRLVQSVDALGVETNRTYDALGRSLTVAVDGASIHETLTTNTYVGNVLWTRDVNHADTFVNHDGLGRTTGIIYPDGTETSVIYDARGHATTVEDRDGRIFNLTYDSLGNPLAKTEPATEIASSWEYDDAGRLIAATDPDGVVTESTWTWAGQPQSVVRGTWTLAEWAYRQDGQPVFANEGGVASVFGYDSLGRRNTACIGAYSTTCAQQKSWTWDAADRVTAETIGTYTTQNQYNSVGWLTREVHPDTSQDDTTYTPRGEVCRYEDENGVRSDWVHDDLGRIASEDLPLQGTRTFSYEFAAGTDDEEVDTTYEPDGGVWTTWTDGVGRAVWAEDGEGNQTTWEYEGTKLTHVEHSDGTGVLAHEGYWYDDAGNLEVRYGPIDDATWESLSGEPDPEAGDYAFAYTHSPAGRVLSRQGPNDLTTWEWTDGVVSGEAIDGIADTAYTYDTDYPRLIQTTMGPTGDERITDRSWYRGLYLQQVDVSAGSESVTTIYGNWDAFGTARQGERKISGTAESAYSLTTNNRGRATQLVQNVSGRPSRTVDWTYNYNGDISTVSTDWAGGLRYNRTGADRGLDTITNWNSTKTLASFASRDDLGRADEIDLYGGAQIERAYDFNGRLGWMKATAATTDYQERTLTWDGMGRLSQLDVDNGSLSLTSTYGYEAHGWLESEQVDDGSPGPLTTYTYDAGGNRTDTSVDSSSVQTATYAYGNQQTEVNSSAPTWNPWGEMTTDFRGYDILRNADGSEFGIDSPSSTPLYGIVRDVAGSPAAIDDGVHVEDLVWANSEGDFPLAGTTGYGGGLLYVGAEGLMLGRLDGTGNFTPTATDHTGSVVMDDAMFAQNPGAFGDTVASGAASRFPYAGLRQLDGTPFQLARHRLYDPAVGRFMGADPIGLAGGDHRFAYVDNAPTGGSDPSGYSAGTVPYTQAGACPEGNCSTPDFQTAHSWDWIQSAREGAFYRQMAKNEASRNKAVGDFLAAAAAAESDPVVISGGTNEGMIGAADRVAMNGDDLAVLNDVLYAPSQWMSVSGQVSSLQKQDFHESSNPVPEGWAQNARAVAGEAQEAAVVWNAATKEYWYFDLSGGEGAAVKAGGSGRTYTPELKAPGGPGENAAPSLPAGRGSSMAPRQSDSRTFNLASGRSPGAGPASGGWMPRGPPMFFFRHPELLRPGIRGPDIGGAMGPAESWWNNGGRARWHLGEDVVGFVPCGVCQLGDVSGAISNTADGDYWSAGFSAASVLGLDPLKGVKYLGKAKVLSRVMESRGGTYVLKEFDRVMRSGRSKNLARRATDHARDPATKDLTFEAVHLTDDAAAQRGLEQMLHDHFQPALDKINGISLRNPNREEYLQAAKAFLAGGSTP